MLAAFIGFEVIRRVSPLLHTPLMSLTNALDAIAVVGAIILAGEHKSRLATVLGTIAIVAATSNVVGGFLITDRMLKMFKIEQSPKSHEQPPGQRHHHRSRLPGRHGAVHPVAQVDELASHGAARRLRRRSWACCWPSSARCFTTASSTTSGSRSRWCWARSSAFRWASWQMTAVPQRTALSHAFGALCVTLVGTAEFYLRAPNVAAVHDGGALAGGHPRLAHLHRQPDGRGQAAGDPAAAAHHL